MKLIKVFLALFLLLACSNSFGQKQNNKPKESPLYYGVYHKNYKKHHHKHHNKTYHRPGTSPVYNKEN